MQISNALKEYPDWLKKKTHKFPCPSKILNTQTHTKTDEKEN